MSLASFVALVVSPEICSPSLIAIAPEHSSLEKVQKVIVSSTAGSKGSWSSSTSHATRVCSPSDKPVNVTSFVS